MVQGLIQVLNCKHVTLGIFLARDKNAEENAKMLQQEPRKSNRICSEGISEKMLVLKRIREISEDSGGHKKHI